MEKSSSQEVPNFLSSATAVTKDFYNYFGSKVILLFSFLIFVSIIEIVGMGLLLPILDNLGFAGDKSDVGFLDILPFDFSAVSLNVLLITTVIIFTLKSAFQYGVDYYSASLSSRYAAHWRTSLFQAFVEADMAFLKEKKSATLINAIMRETDRVRLCMVQLSQIVKILFSCLAYFIVAVSISWETCLLLGVFGGVSVLVVRPLSRRADSIGKNTYTAIETLQKYAVEFLQASKLLKATASEGYARSVIGGSIENVAKFSKQEVSHPFMVHGIFEILGILTLTSVIFITVNVFDVSGARMIVALFLFMRIYNRISTMEQHRQVFRIYVSSFYELCALRKSAIENAERYTHSKSQHIDLLAPPEIIVAGLNLSYGEKKVLRDVNVTISAGSIVGLVGGSGAGKTSLVDTILGLAKPESGDVLVNGENIDQYDVRSFRKYVGYVAQQTILFHDTVANNISWGDAKGSREEIVQAAKMAQAHEFILKLPQGYDTVVGDDGQTLSGGQRQRLGLARALMGNKKLLILDETTSALDMKTEAEVTKILESLRGVVTSVIITHRLSTLHIADKIYVLAAGEVVEEGRYESLKKGGEVFRSLLGNNGGGGVEE